MSFIPKNPLILPEISNPPSPPMSGTRGVFASEDGWYEIDSNGKVCKLATFKYLGGVDLNQILPAGMYSIDYFESSGTPEIDSIDIEMPYCTLIISPPKLIDGGWEVVHQLLFIHDTVTTISYLFQRIIERSSQGEVGACGWTMISTSENGGTVNPGDIDLSDYYTKDVTDEMLDGKTDRVPLGLADVAIFRNSDGTETLKIARHIQRVGEDGSTEWDVMNDDEHKYYNMDKMNELLSEKAYVSKVEEVEAIAKGRAAGYVFDTYDMMVAWIDDEEKRATLKLGDNLYIRALDVPDYWWDGSSPQPLETQKVDLSEYVEKEDEFGLSESRSVGLYYNDDDTLLTITYQNGSSQGIRLYDTYTIDEKFAELPKAEDIDLSNYYTKEEIDETCNDGIVTLKKNISFTVGDNIVTSDTPIILSDGWTKGSSGEYIHSSANKLTNPLEVQIEADDGAIYYVEWDLDFDKATSQSSASVAIGDSYSQDTYFGKNHIEMIVKCEGGGSLYITPLDSFNGSIANISCKPLTDGDGLTITQEFNGIYMDDVNTDNYGRWNVILSDNAMLDTVNSTRSIAIGHSALNGCKGGNRNIAIGTFSMSKMTGGERNISIGSDAMLEVKAATDNIVIGFGAMYYGNNMLNNTVIGVHAMQGNGTNPSNAKENTIIGYNAGYYNTGNVNTFVGRTSGYDNTTGYNNVGVGAAALSGNKTGGQNTAIGVGATVTNGVNQSISIGASAKATKSNQAVIGRQYTVSTNGTVSGIKETILYGDLIVYGTDAVARNVATEDYVDGKIAEISLNGNDGSIDLSGYIQKEEGYGLSGARDVYIMENEGTEDEENYADLCIENQYGEESTLSIYNKEIVDALLGKKQNARDVQMWQADESIDDNVYSLILIDSLELYTSTISYLTIRTNSFPLGAETFINFIAGENMIIDDKTNILKWIGDDCDASGSFTPIDNTEYEISFKCMKNGIIARVGAC